MTMQGSCATHITPPPPPYTARAVPRGVPSGVPPDTRILAAAKACFIRHTQADRPGTGYRRYGPVKLMVGFTDRGLALLHIISDTPKRGYGARALSFLIHLAESYGLRIIANAQPIRSTPGCMDQPSLLDWYLSFGFERVPESSMNGIRYVPASRPEMW